nr:MAG TPA: hypothetical protein [Inoviridae sp.]
MTKCDNCVCCHCTKMMHHRKTIVPIHNQLQQIIERLTRIEEAE